MIQYVSAGVALLHPLTRFSTQQHLIPNYSTSFEDAIRRYSNKGAACGHFVHVTVSLQAYPPIVICGQCGRGSRGGGTVIGWDLILQH